MLIFPLFILLSFSSTTPHRIPSAHIYSGEQIGNTNNGKLGICACPGLLNSRPSRADDCKQPSVVDDITTLNGLYNVTDVFVIAMDWELKHYNGIDSQEYLSELSKQGLTVHPYYVQETKAPTLQVSFYLSKIIFFSTRSCQ
tara:strand:- start:450 stop:875 length:426 start_codon:yes stop_codon:yes gene_type:complete